MNSSKKHKFGLTNNQLKIIAMVSMLLDHIGLLFFPEISIAQMLATIAPSALPYLDNETVMLFLNVPIFRALGRIAFPIFAYMIAEGCRHTKNRAKYLGMIGGMAIVFQIVYFVAMGSLYQGILVTFLLAIIAIYSIDGLLFPKRKFWGRVAAIFGLAFVAVFVWVLPRVLVGTDYDLDYGIWGILLPILVYFMPNRFLKTSGASLFLIIRALFYIFVEPMPLQAWSLLTIPLLALYNGERGKRKMKYVFYIFYPAHLVILYGIAMLIEILK